MVSTKIEKVTVSLPSDLVVYADTTAAALGTSRSQVIGRALTNLRAAEQEELAREGYRFYGREAEEFASASSQAVAEALRDAS